MRDIFWGDKSENEYRMDKLEVYDMDDKVKLSPASILFKQRIITFFGAVEQYSVSLIQEQLLALDAMEHNGKKHQDIIMYINSPGGSVYQGFVIYDTMQHIKSDVVTVCTGVAASMGSLLLSAGAAGKRYALPHSRIVLHSVSSAKEGKQIDIEISGDELREIYSELLKIYIRHTPKNKNGKIDRWGGQTDMEKLAELEPKEMDDKEARKWLRKWLHLDRYMSPGMAKRLGFIDDIVESNDMPHYKNLKKD